MLLKRVIKILKYLVLSFAVLFALILAGINLPPVQKSISKRANSFFIRKDLPVQVERVTLLISGKIGVRALRILDQEQDTIVYAEKINVSARTLPILFRKIIVKNITLRNAVVNISVDSITGNPDIIALFSEGRKPAQPDKKDKKKWEVNGESLTLSNIRFRYRDYGSGMEISQSVGKLDIGIDELSILSKRIFISSLDLSDATGGLITGSSKPEEAHSVKPAKATPWEFRLSKSDLRRIHFTLDQPVANRRLTFRIGHGEISDAGFELASKRITAGKTGISEGSVVKGSLNGDTTSASGSSLIDISELSTLIRDLVLSKGNSGFTMDELSFLMGNGIILKKGAISVTSDSVNGSNLKADLKTGFGKIRITADAGAALTDILSSYRGIPFKLKIDDTELAGSEIIALLPSLAKKPSVKGNESLIIGISCDLSGTADNLALNDITLKTSRDLNFSASGTVTGITEPETALLSLSFRSGSILPLHARDLVTLLGSPFDIPEFNPMTIEGTIDSTLANPAFTLAVEGGSGNIKLDGNMNLERKEYSLAAMLTGIDIGVLSGVSDAGKFTGSVNLQGRDFDPLLMKIMASVAIDTMQFRQYDYIGINLNVKGDSGVFEIALKSADESFYCNLNGSADINNSSLTGSLEGQLDIDAGRLNLIEEMSFSGVVDSRVQRSEGKLEGTLSLIDLIIDRKGNTGELDNLSVAILYSDTIASGTITSDFLKADAFYKGPPGGIMKLLRENRLRGFAMVDSAVGNRIPYLSAITEMHMSVESVYDPFIGLFVNDSVFSYNRLSANVSKDTTGVAKAEIWVDRINAGKGKVSGASVNLESLSDRSVLDIKADSVRFGNITLNALASMFIVRDDSAKFQLKSGSKVDSLSYDISGTAFRSEGEIRLKSDRRDWIINGYRWNVSAGDFLVLEPRTDDFTADLHLSNESHAIDIYGRKSEKLSLETTDLGLNMILPPGMEGFRYNGIFTGKIDFMSSKGRNELGVIMDIDKITMDDNLLGRIGIEGNYSSDTLGTVESDLNAVINDTTDIKLRIRSSELKREKSIRAEFNDIQLHNFESFVSKYISGLQGIVSGQLQVVSKDEIPEINGNLRIKNTSLKLIPVNSWYFLSDDAIRIDNSRLIFNSLTVRDSLMNPLTINGILDLKDPSNITSDLKVASDNIRVMNTTASDNAGFNGSIFINSTISIQGPLNNPSISGNLVLARGTVVNYQYTENLSVSETGKIVTFASLREEERDTSVSRPVSDLITRTPDIEATVEIDPNSLFNFNVSKGFDISISITGGGFLTYSLMPNREIDLSGVYEINQGFARLKLPGWPRKDFIITKGSVIRWDGKIDDPDLSIETTSNVRGSYVNPVDNKQREVNFVVTMRIEGRLSEITIIFDVRSPDQYLTTFFNSLSADERMKQAINLLIFEKVELPGQTSSSNYLTQQINQFAENQINQVTKSASKKLDLDVSLGLDTYTRETSTGEQTTTSFSYQFKKDMFNERGSILLSGHTNSGAKANQQTNAVIENFIFEYALDSIRSKFLKVYWQQNYEDLLEGEVIKSGVGFIYRKSYDRLSDIWRREKKSKNKNVK